MKRIAIIGGGISGLSAAFAIEKQKRSGLPVEYVLYEASGQFGGVLRTEKVDGCIVEAGPDSFLTEKSWAADFCREIGIGDQLISSNDAERKTYILVNGRLLPLPDGLMFMVPTEILPVVFSPLFSLHTKLCMAREWFSAPRNSPDESVAQMVERHYGAEMVERLAEPLLSGVYGGEASQLGVRSVLPRFAEMESQYGSLGKAMLAARKKSIASGLAKPIFTSLKNGMQQLVDALSLQLDQRSLRAKTSVTALQRTESAWSVSTPNRSENFDGVILASPAPNASSLLHDAAPALSQKLGDIAYTSSITVALGYGNEVRSPLPPGFGFLVPRSEGKSLLAATFVHNKFPFRAPGDRALIRCFLGGARQEQTLEMPDEKILSRVRDELRQILGISAEPIFTRIYRWKSAMAQYNVGHVERVQRIDALCSQIPTLALAGNAYRGIGIPDCIRSGENAAARVLAGVGIASVEQKTSAS